MSRTVYITASRVWEARQFWYAHHYDKRVQASGYPSESAYRTLKSLEQMPEPQIDICGALDTWTYCAINAKPIEEQAQLLRECGTPAEFFVKWYWSARNWDGYVQQFNALPEPEPLYEIVYENHPVYRVVPEKSGTTRVQVGDNPGTSRVQVGYNLKVVPEKA